MSLIWKIDQILKLVLYLNQNIVNVIKICEILDFILLGRCVNCGAILRMFLELIDNNYLLESILVCTGPAPAGQSNPAQCSGDIIIF
jgi:hypothetical protein